MDFITGQEGQLNKLTITVCDEKKQYTPKKGDDSVYTALVNPEEIKKTFSIEYSQKQAGGTSAANLVFKKQRPGNLTISLLFDGTGVLANDRAPFSNLLSNIKPVSVQDQLKVFKKVVYDYDSDKHQPNVVQIKLGEQVLMETAKLLSLDLTYSLFKPSGEPLRAKANCTFAYTISDDERLKRDKPQSPDLTRIRTVKKGDSLPLMCFEIYGNSKYYLEVARVNKLQNFRTLTVGDKIFFPPLDKTSA
jgi:hypothetical protein